MIRIRPFVINDLNRVTPRPIYPKGIKEEFAKSVHGNPSYTLYDSVTDTFCPVRLGVCHINMICDNDFVIKKKEFILTLRDGIVHFMNQLKLRRVHTTIRADFPTAEKWIKILGFEKEGLMRKFGPEGEDHFLFSKVVS